MSPLRRPSSLQLVGVLVPLVLGAEGKRIFTEDRKVYAVVAGLVLVALALSLLTVGYWRRTKPVRPQPARGRVTAPAVASGRVARLSVAGADHAAADDVWESHATGEHKRIDPPKQMARPGVDARRAALERAARTTAVER